MAERRPCWNHAGIPTERWQGCYGRGCLGTGPQVHQHDLGMNFYDAYTTGALRFASSTCFVIDSRVFQLCPDSLTLLRHHGVWLLWLWITLLGSE